MTNRWVATRQLGLFEKGRQGSRPSNFGPRGPLLTAALAILAIGCNTSTIATIASPTEGGLETATIGPTSIPAETLVIPTDTATVTPTAVPSDTPTVTPTPTDTPEPLILNPLTGLPVPDASTILRRPIGIKVSNYPRTARPQAGLSSADALFEFYQEGGETRWHAIFLGTDAVKVGPIRSARKVDARLEQIFQSILVFNAADYRVWNWFGYEDVRRFTLVEGGAAPCPAICRDTSQIQINQVYANTAEIRKAAANVGIPDAVPDLTGWVFREEPPAMKTPVTTVRVRYLTNKAIAEWRYNPDDHLYYRWSETDDKSGTLEPLTDRLTGKQIAVSNLAVTFVNYERTTGTEIYEVEFFGAGMALLFRDGMLDLGTWRMPKINRLPHFFGESSTGPFFFRPGVTWFTLVEDSSTFTVDGETAHVEFGQPRG